MKDQGRDCRDRQTVRMSRPCLRIIATLASTAGIAQHAYAMYSVLSEVIGVRIVVFQWDFHFQEMIVLYLLYPVIL